jgi:hypothetical protein
MNNFKRHKDYSFWDQDLRLSKISKLGDPLEKLNNGVNFENSCRNRRQHRKFQ